MVKGVRSFESEMLESFESFGIFVLFWFVIFKETFCFFIKRVFSFLYKIWLKGIFIISNNKMAKKNYKPFDKKAVDLIND